MTRGKYEVGQKVWLDTDDVYSFDQLPFYEGVFFRVVGDGYCEVVRTIRLGVDGITKPFDVIEQMHLDNVHDSVDSLAKAYRQNFIKHQRQVKKEFNSALKRGLARV